MDDVLEWYSPREAMFRLPPKLWCNIELGPVHPRLGTPCWLWTGRLNRNGYGRVCIDGHEPVAHRAVYERLVGDIPHKHLLDHKCETRRCVNPQHLEPVTHKVNTERGKAVLFKRPEDYAIPAKAAAEAARPDVLGPDGDGCHQHESVGPGEHDTCLHQGEPTGESVAVQIGGSGSRSEADGVSHVDEDMPYGDARDYYLAAQPRHVRWTLIAHAFDVVAPWLLALIIILFFLAVGFGFDG